MDILFRGVERGRRVWKYPEIMNGNKIMLLVLAGHEYENFTTTKTQTAIHCISSDSSEPLREDLNQSRGRSLSRGRTGERERAQQP